MTTTLKPAQKKYLSAGSTRRFAIFDPSHQSRNVLQEVRVTLVSESRGSRRIRANAPELLCLFWRTVIARSPWFDDLKEHLVCVMLNTRLDVTGWNLVSIGSLNETMAHPREILRPAIVCGCYGFVLMHNHPSGFPAPSLADREITQTVKNAAKLVQITLLDHVIVGDFAHRPLGYFSFKEEGEV